MKYKVTLYILNDIEFEGVLEEKDNKLYIQTIQDNSDGDVEEMFKQLYCVGYITIDDKDDIKMITFNSLQEIFDELKVREFDIRIERI